MISRVHHEWHSIPHRSLPVRRHHNDSQICTPQTEFTTKEKDLGEKSLPSTEPSKWLRSSQSVSCGHWSSVQYHAAAARSTWLCASSSSISLFSTIASTTSSLICERTTKDRAEIHEFEKSELFYLFQIWDGEREGRQQPSVIVAAREAFKGLGTTRKYKMPAIPC